MITKKKQFSPGNVEEKIGINSDSIITKFSVTTKDI